MPNLFGHAHTPLLKCTGACLQLTIDRGVRHFSKGVRDFEITVISQKSMISIVIS